MKKMTNWRSSSSLDEVLFENRNKAYGAYVLRHEADVIAAKSLWVGVGLFAFMALVPLIVSNHWDSTNVPKASTQDPVWVLIEPLKPQPPAIKMETPSIKVLPKVTSATTTKPVRSLPVPVRSPKEVQPVAPIVSIVQESPSIPIGTGAHTPNETLGITTAPTEPSQASTPPAVPSDPNAIYGSVDVGADFRSGIQTFRSQVLQRFDGSDFIEQREMLRTTVNFVVEKDGTLSSIRAEGPSEAFNKEAVRTVSSIKGKWRPAQVGGKPVRSQFRFPISMQFE